MMVFDYVERKTRRGESVWSPHIPVTILGGLCGQINGIVLVDTGADRSHLPLALGTQLVPLSECDELLSTWGHDFSAPVYAPRSPLLAQVGEVIVPIRPVFADFRSAGMLGMDFLAHFRATFDGPARRLELELRT